MRSITCIILMLFFMPASGVQSAELKATEKMMENIQWLGHDSFKIKAGEKIIYIDPWKLENPEKADIILITHEHSDHFSPDDVKLIQSAGTTIISTAKVISRCSGNTIVLLPGNKIEIGNITIEGVPAYNVNKKFHPRENNNLGFIITFEGVRIYHAGDTDLIPEMKDFNVDIAFLPVSGIYVMTAEEAIEAVKLMKPKIAVPMHYGRGIGSEDDAKRFNEGKIIWLAPK